MIDLIISANQQIVEMTGETHSVLRPDRLEALVGRIENSYYSEHFAFDAAILIQGIAHDHPFEQGNKRTGFAMMKAVILENRHILTANEDNTYDFVLAVVEGMEIEEIANWILLNIRKLD
jgi:death on curing protein